MYRLGIPIALPSMIFAKETCVEVEYSGKKVINEKNISDTLEIFIMSDFILITKLLNNNLRSLMYPPLRKNQVLAIENKNIKGIFYK